MELVWPDARRAAGRGEEDRLGKHLRGGGSAGVLMLAAAFVVATLSAQPAPVAASESSAAANPSSVGRDVPPRVRKHPKLDSQLLAISEQLRAGGPGAALDTARERNVTVQGGNARVIVHAAAAELSDAATGAG